MLAGSKWKELWDRTHTPDGTLIPKMLTGRFIDIPVDTAALMRLAALAPPEVKLKSTPRKRKGEEATVIKRAREYLAKIDPAISGQHGHDITYRAACTLVIDFDLSIDEARPLLEEFNERCQPPWTEAELDHKLESADKSPGERGLLLIAAPEIEVREVIPLDVSTVEFLPMSEQADLPSLPSVDDSPVEECPFGSDTPIVDADDPLASIGFALTPDGSSRFEEKPLATVAMNWMSARCQEGRTDIANGKRLAKFIQGKARYIPAWDSWVVWDGKRWRRDELGIREFAKQIPATILADSMSPLPVDVPACQWGMKSTSRAALEAMISMAKSEPGIAIEHSDLDADPWLLNCQNGTVDLRNGKLLPHNPANLITRITNVDYDPDAASFEWDRFLEKILVKDDLISHVQRLIGYCITGSTREQVLPIFWGEGSNGKSTMLDTLKAALGVEYASTAPPALIMAKKGESHPTELAGLCGKRMVTAIETEKGQRLNEPLVKQLTGGDSIMARRMREDFWEFRPTHKLVLCTNHEPRVGDDYAIWRRIVMVPFVVQFWNPDEGETGPEDLRRDNRLANRLEQCLPGVLAWAVRGAVEWFANGLGRTDDVKAATAAYRKRQDFFGRFVEDRCLTGNQYRVKFSELYDQYSDWANEVGERVASKKSFGDWLQSQKDSDGFPMFQKNHSVCVWYVGISWKPEYDKNNSFESF